jgi:transposase InsO family protein
VIAGQRFVPREEIDPAISGRCAIIHAPSCHWQPQRWPLRPGAGLIHHSDRGVQYASAEYRKLMQSAGLRASMSRKADCYDNAPMESFFHTLKTELVHHRHDATRTEAVRDIFVYRGLLQSNASSLRHRLHQPDRDGAKSSLTLSIFSGEDQSKIG